MHCARLRRRCRLGKRLPRTHRDRIGTLVGIRQGGHGRSVRSHWHPLTADLHAPRLHLRLVSEHRESSSEPVRGTPPSWDAARRMPFGGRRSGDAVRGMPFGGCRSISAPVALGPDPVRGHACLDERSLAALTNEFEPQTRYPAVPVPTDRAGGAACPRACAARIVSAPRGFSRQGHCPIKSSPLCCTCVLEFECMAIPS
jgi:hypothetical protein